MSTTDSTPPFHKKLEIRQHSMAIYDLAIPVNDTVITASADCFVATWDLLSGTQKGFTIKADFPVYSIELVEKDLLSVGLNNGDLHIIDIHSKKEIRFFKKHTSALFSQLFIPQKSVLITGDADGNMAVWNTKSWEILIYLPLGCGKIRSIIYSLDSEQLFIGGQDGKIRIFTTDFYNEIDSFYAHKDGVNALTIFPGSSSLLLSGGKDGYLRIWDLDKNEKIKALPAHNYAVYAIAFSPDGKAFATASRDKSIKIWDTASYQVLQKLETKTGGHSHSVNKIKWTPSGLFSASDDRRLIHWVH